MFEWGLGSLYACCQCGSSALNYFTVMAQMCSADLTTYEAFWKDSKIHPILTNYETSPEPMRLISMGRLAQPERIADLNLQDDRHDQRPPLRLLRNVALQVSANFLFDNAVVRLFFVAGLFKRFHDDLPRALEQAVVARIKAACDNLQAWLPRVPVVLVDGDDGKNETVFAEMPPIFDHEIFNHIRPPNRSRYRRALY